MELLVLLAIGATLFAWVVGIAEIAGTPDDGFAEGTRTTWLLLVILTGVIGLVAYVFVGKKGGAASLAARPASAAVSPNRAPSTNAIGFGTVEPSRSVVPPTPSVQSEHKACPDCAEDVRSAARKCRFCGYTFDETPSSGLPS